MRLNSTCTKFRAALAAATLVLAAAGNGLAQDEARKVAGGGISAAGWTGKADGGASINDTKLTKEGNTLHITTGPAAAFWNSSDKARGKYTVKATFNEPNYLKLNNPPHPYGLFIGGNDMGTDQQSYLYCAAYGNGTFIVRGFGPQPFQMGGRRPEANAAVHKAEGPGQPVSQEIAMSVKGDKVECSINGSVVASYDKSAVVGPGKLKSTDGIYGIRFAHNTEGTVTGLTVTKD